VLPHDFGVVATFLAVVLGQEVREEGDGAAQALGGRRKG
jgi:hypothetical protein